MLPPDDLMARLRAVGQEQVMAFWSELDSPARAELIAELEAIDLDQLRILADTLVHSSPEPAHGLDEVAACEVIRLPRTDGERVARRLAAELGESMLAAGEVAVVLVAGGQGTRLGFDGPKGTYPIGPVSGNSLFQIHAEKVRALGRRYGKPIPLYIMTSFENDTATRAFFEKHDRFGLRHLRCFVQGQMPALDAKSGRMLLTDKGRIALSPDGHGGALDALAKPAPGGAPSCLDEMRSLGVRVIFYFQVDNPLVKIAEPAFLGQHRQGNSQISFKVVEKVQPDEKVGLVVLIDGCPQVIEYSDLPSELAERRQPDGSLELWAGSIAIHAFELDYVEGLIAGHQMPFHRALKKVNYLDCQGKLVVPRAANAVKFERFIFDALPLAQRFVVVETDRATEFEPLKNATGPDSPATVRQRMSDLYAGWLESAGATVARRADGSASFGIEISPLFALDCAELKSKIKPNTVVDGPVYFK